LIAHAFDEHDGVRGNTSESAERAHGHGPDSLP
jgi:hypothetical protein